MREPIEAAEIRDDTFTDRDGIMSFISDSYSDRSSYMVIINTDEKLVTATCVEFEDRLHDNWTCPDTSHWGRDVSD